MIKKLQFAITGTFSFLTLINTILAAVKISCFFNMNMFEQEFLRECLHAKSLKPQKCTKNNPIITEIMISGAACSSDGASYQHDLSAQSLH